MKKYDFTFNNAHFNYKQGRCLIVEYDSSPFARGPSKNHFVFTPVIGDEQEYVTFIEYKSFYTNEKPSIVEMHILDFKEVLELFGPTVAIMTLFAGMFRFFGFILASGLIPDFKERIKHSRIRGFCCQKDNIDYDSPSTENDGLMEKILDNYLNPPKPSDVIDAEYEVK